MPLLDHFHPPLQGRRQWPGFHAAWLNSQMASLNTDILPEKYYAEAHVYVGGRLEVELATLEHGEAPPDLSANRGGGTAVQSQIWAPPEPPVVLTTSFPDEFEVQIYSTKDGLQLVAAVELVSPANKDRQEHRRAFVSKCHGYLQVGIGLVIIDVVTERLANLHNELMEWMEQDGASQLSDEQSLYAVAYRPIRREAGDQVDCWPHPLTLAQSMPIVPLPLRDGPIVPLDLESTYLEACQRSRIPVGN